MSSSCSRGARTGSGLRSDHRVSFRKFALLAANQSSNVRPDKLIHGADADLHKRKDDLRRRSHARPIRSVHPRVGSFDRHEIPPRRDVAKLLHGQPRNLDLSSRRARGSIGVPRLGANRQ